MDLSSYLSSFVPDLIIQRRTLNPEPIREATSERFQAACLFTDFSGFTRLTETLEARVQTQTGAGPELLTEVINAYFDPLIKLIVSHGGQIVKFTGDGIMAIWPTAGNPNDFEIGELRQNTRLAAQCGLEIQKRLHNYEAQKGSQLTMRIGVGAGEIYMVHIGGVFQRWEFLVAGELVIQSGLAEGQALPGQVVLSNEAYQLVRHFSNGSPVPTEHARLHGGGLPGFRLSGLTATVPRNGPEIFELTNSQVASIRPYIPAAVIYRVEAGQMDWLAELRRLTILFINLSDQDYTTLEGLNRSHRVMRTLQETIYRYEGSINKLNVDDKGVTLVAGFGLPPYAHEDDASRGAQAALEAQNILSAEGVECTIGIATGPSFCGVIGSESRREYTMMGATVNLAARLMQAAPNPIAPPWNLKGDAGTPLLKNAILCDENTFQSAQHSLEFEKLPPINVKGKAGPVGIYRPIKSIRANPLDQIGQRKKSTTLVGRSEERFHIAEQLQALQRGGEGAVLLIEGEAGIGKSRLIEDLMIQAETMGIQRLIGAGDAIERSKPYHAWRSVFRQIFEMGESTGRASGSIPNFSGFFKDKEIIRMSPLLNKVLDMDIPDNEYTKEMVQQVRADNTRNLLVQLIQIYVDRGPTVLVLEDGHWLDPTSWDILSAVWKNVHPLLLVLATRPLPSPAPTEYNEIVHGENVERTALDSLPPEETITLVCQRLGVSRLPPEIAKLIHNRAEGHPFYSEELAYALRDTGIILIEDGVCKIAPGTGELADLPFPNTVQGVITSRIDRLAPSEQLTLKIASVIGRFFSYPVLYNIHPIQSDKPLLQDYLNHLESLDITPLEIPEPDPTYIFKHNITQEVSYNLLPFSQREMLHKEVANFYEKDHIDDLEPYYSLLAYHWSKASVPEKAVEYFSKAGEEALRNGAYREAIGFLKNALDWNKRISTDENVIVQVNRTWKVLEANINPAKWERQLGQAYLGVGQLNLSLEHTRNSLKYLHISDPEKSAELAASAVIAVLRQISHRALPRRNISRSKDGHTIILESARAYNTLSELHYFNNQILSIANAVFYTVNLSDNLGPSPELAEALAGMGFLMGVIPIHRFARAYLREARETAEIVERSSTLGYVDLINALYTVAIGAWEESQQTSWEAVEIFRELGNQRRRGDALALHAQSNHFEGNFEKSRKLYEDLYRLSLRNGDVQQLTWGIDGQAQNLIRLGQAEAAIELLKEAYEPLEKSNDLPEELVHRGVLAVAYLYGGQTANAIKAVKDAINLSLGSSPVYSTLEGYAGVAEVLLTLWEESLNDNGDYTYGESAREACKVLTNFGKRFPIGKPRSLIWQGVCEYLSGKTSKAERLLKRALENAQSMKMPYEIGLANFHLGRIITDSEFKKIEHLRRAKEIFTELGAIVDLNKVTKLY